MKRNGGKKGEKGSQRIVTGAKGRRSKEYWQRKKSDQ